MQWQGLNGRPIARNSAGRIFDLGNRVEDVQIGGSAADPVRIECILLTTNGSGDLTHTFANAYASAPSVTLTAVATSGTQVTIAELIGISATQVQIRTYRTRTQGVFLGGNINPTERVSAQVIAQIIGVPA